MLGSPTLGAVPVVYVTSHLILRVPVALLNFALQLISATSDHVKIIIGELTSLLLHLSLHLLPISLDAIPVHGVAPVYRDLTITRLGNSRSRQKVALCPSFRSGFRRARSRAHESAYAGWERSRPGSAGCARPARPSLLTEVDRAGAIGNAIHHPRRPRATACVCTRQQENESPRTYLRRVAKTEKADSQCAPPRAFLSRL